MSPMDEKNRQVELLEEYVAALSANPAAAPPDGLDPELAVTARLLVREPGAERAGTSSPAPEFVAALRRRLEHEAESLQKSREPEGAAADERQSSETLLRNRWSSVWLYPAAALALAFLVIVLILPASLKTAPFGLGPPPGATVQDSTSKTTLNTTEHERRRTMEQPPATTKAETTARNRPDDVFQVLRPGWLPRVVVSVREERRVDAAGVPYVVLYFEHRPGDASQAPVLTLDEQRAGAGTAVVPPAPEERTARIGGAVGDPLTTTERIGDREVTVRYRSDACMGMYWEQDGLALSLTNTYDPPGQPLYSCTQMRRVVESVGV